MRPMREAAMVVAAHAEAVVVVLIAVLDPGRAAFVLEGVATQQVGGFDPLELLGEPQGRLRPLASPGKGPDAQAVNDAVIERRPLVADDAFGGGAGPVRDVRRTGRSSTGIRSGIRSRSVRDARTAARVIR